MDLKKKIIITVAGCAAILCAFAGVGHLLPKQEPIELETVSDEVPAEEEKAPFEVEAKGAVMVDADTGQVLFQQDAHDDPDHIEENHHQSTMLREECICEHRVYRELRRA